MDEKVSNKDEMIPDDLLPPSDEESDEERELTVVNANRQNVAVYEETDSEESEDENGWINIIYLQSVLSLLIE